MPHLRAEDCFDGSTRLDSSEIYNKLSKPKTACNMINIISVNRFSSVNKPSITIALLLFNGVNAHIYYVLS